MSEAPRACPKCGEKKAPRHGRGAWWWPENGYIYCRHCRAAYSLKDLPALRAAEEEMREDRS